MKSERIRLTVNGIQHELEVNPGEMLNGLLRDRIALTGTKKGCDTGGCGACTVIMNDRPVYSCMTFALKAGGARILTIEGLEVERDRSVQRAFVEHNALQCGYCTPGFIMSAVSLLRSNSKPTEEEVRYALVGNICRCSGYAKIIEAVQSLSQEKVKVRSSQ